MKKLTIGLATHDDFDGLYFSIQSVRLHHKEILNDVEFVIIDNNPESVHGKAIRDFIKWVKEPVQYLPFTKHQSSTVKNKIFELADTKYVLCMDSHVMLEPGAFDKLIKFYESGEDKGNLLQGPLIYDDMTSISSHFDLTKWGSQMWGAWANDPRADDINGNAFEIPAQGMGLFSCRKESWLGFNKEFRGFGGEEGYIHEKYRKNGKKTLCLPFLRWLHRFPRPVATSYPNRTEDRFRNYYIGFKELDIDTTELFKQFPQYSNAEYLAKLDLEISKF